MRLLIQLLCVSSHLALAPTALAQAVSSSGNLPRVVIPTSRPAIQNGRPLPQRGTQLYPWRKHIMATVFWIGEQPTQNNPTPNCKSSWDQNWMANFGGYDDPKPSARIADHRTSEFRPKAFIPKLNPFYIALPYNDIGGYRSHKSEAKKVIPWFKQASPAPGKTCLKGRWIQIYHAGRSCYAQWEDCGPWNTSDWQYVFGNRRPKNRSNQGAAIDISPSIRDYLGLQSGERCHWRFVEASQVPHGPWKKYGQPQTVAGGGADLESKRKYLEYLRKLRDQQYKENGSRHSRN